ncbi:hypothetical protein [Chondromyces crocatus]|nr:hypothetical protein [Chondromyces crocatus]
MRALRASFALAALVGGAVTGFAACSVEECVGGIVIDGVCQGKCEPSLCKDQNTCVGNQCKLLCDSHQACNTNTQECLPAVEDETNANIMVCQPKQKAAGFGVVCPFGQQQCEGLAACPDGSACGADACGGRPEQCTDRGDGTTTCADGSPCCPAEQCIGLVCLSSGEGDADAYCSLRGCSGDEDCPGGYACGVTRDPRAVCGTDKGNHAACGFSSEPCIDLATAGDTYAEGSMCALRKTCIKRDQCDPCESDLDCSLADGTTCVDIGGSNRCARACNADSDCDVDYACQGGSCKPRFGSCAGEGAFCQPCQDDLDCGPNALCTPIAGLDKQKACLPWERPDPNGPGVVPALPCTTDDDCPLSPSGIMRGECLNEDNNYEPGDSGYGRCYFPYSATVQRFGCWYECDVGGPGFPPEPANPRIDCPSGTTCREGFCK